MGKARAGIQVSWHPFQGLYTIPGSVESVRHPGNLHTFLFIPQPGPLAPVSSGPLHWWVGRPRSRVEGKGLWSIRADTSEGLENLSGGETGRTYTCKKWCPVFPEWGPFVGLNDRAQHGIEHPRWKANPPSNLQMRRLSLRFDLRPLFFSTSSVPLLLDTAFLEGSTWSQLSLTQHLWPWSHKAVPTSRQVTVALECCGEGPKVQKGGWGLLLSRFKVGKKITIPGAFRPHTSPCLAWQDTERFQARSQELEQKLLSKERELEQLIQKQKRVGSCLCPHRPGLTAPSAVAHAHFPCH